MTRPKKSLRTWQHIAQQIMKESNLKKRAALAAELDRVIETMLQQAQAPKKCRAKSAA
jgi:hypothetical protein